MDLKLNLTDLSQEQVVVGVDPGDSTGIAALDLQGRPIWGANLRDDQDILESLDELKGADIVALIIEDFQLLPHKAQAQIGSKFKTVQVMGQFEMWAKMNKVEVFKQSPPIKSIAMKWSKIKPKGAHKDNHYVDAINHAFYWMVRRGYIEPKRG